MKSLLDNWMVVDVDKLVAADWNYKEEDEFLDTQLRNGIKKRGVVQNLLVRRLDGERLEVVNGNHRLPIIRQLGHKKVVVYNLGDVSIAEAKRAAIETNEIAYESNQLKLAALLRDISEEVPLTQLLETMPYDSEHMDALLKTPSFDMAEYTKSEQPMAISNESVALLHAPEAPPQTGLAEHDPIAPVVVGESAGSITMVAMKKDIYMAFREQIDRITAMLVSDGRLGTKDELKAEGNVTAIDILTRSVKELSDGTIRRVIKNYASETPLETPTE
jgi:hypothetical protein